MPLRCNSGVSAARCAIQWARGGAMTMRISSNPKAGGAASIVLVGFIAAALAPTLAFGGQAPLRAVTFTRDIAPILQRSCENCHRTSGVAPMPLTTYEEVRPWARAIKQRTSIGPKAGVMPPWYLEKNI